MSTIYNITINGQGLIERKKKKPTHTSLPSHTGKQRNITTLAKYVERGKKTQPSIFKGGTDKRGTPVCSLLSSELWAQAACVASHCCGGLSTWHTGE